MILKYNKPMKTTFSSQYYGYCNTLSSIASKLYVHANIKTGLFQWIIKVKKEFDFSVPFFNTLLDLNYQVHSVKQNNAHLKILGSWCMIKWHLVWNIELIGSKV